MESADQRGSNVARFLPESLRAGRGSDAVEDFKAWAARFTCVALMLLLADLIAYMRRSWFKQLKNFTARSVVLSRATSERDAQLIAVWSFLQLAGGKECRDLTALAPNTKVRAEGLW